MLSPILLAQRTLTGMAGATGDEVRNGLADKIAGFFDYIIGQVPSWIAGFVVFALTIFAAKIAKSAVEAKISDQVDEEHQDVLILAGRMTYFGILTLGITVALKIAGIDLTTILAAAAFGIGFALKDLLMNFISGIMILMSRQFTIGDFIRVGSTFGRVVEIQTRATILKAIDGTKVIVPNSEIFTNVVISATTNPFRRIEIPLYASYDSDVQYVIKTALRVLNKHPKIMKKPAPTILFKNYGDSCLEFGARFWVGSRDGWLKIKSDVMHKILKAFENAGINIPYNILHLETSQDTAEYDKETEALSQAGIAKMKEAAMKKKLAAGTVPAGTAPAPQNGNGQSTSLQTADAQIPAAVPLQTAAQAVPVTTEGEFQDLTEIDGQG